jgi:hypothetical protein
LHYNEELEMTLALVLFAIAAAGGAFLAFLRLSNRPLPIALALGHGALAATGLAALAVHALGPAGTERARLALGIFVAAALGGFTLFSFHLRRKQLPVPLVVVHGAVAVVAFLVLLSSVLAAS